MRPSESDLRRWYIDERKSTRVIAAELGVSHMSVKRWLRAYGIQARPRGRGLANREIAAPSADELRRLIHDEHLGYRGVAAIYGVDPSAVMHWLKRHRIERPTIWGTRYGGDAPAIPDAAELRRLYVDDRLSINAIARSVGVSGTTISQRLSEIGVELRHDDGWSRGRHAMSDGHHVRSTYEVRVCEWLTSHGIPHTYEPSYPFDRRMHADFFANGWYIEIWGVVENPAYATRRAKKVKACRDHGLPLLEISAHHFGRRRNHWLRLLTRCFESLNTLPLFAP